MKKYEEMFTLTPNLLLSKILFLQKKVKALGGEINIVHRYLFEFILNNSSYFIKINLLDNEFFVFQNNKPVLYFTVYSELQEWILNQIKFSKTLYEA